MKCLCGRNATHFAYLPMLGVYAGLKQVNEKHSVCPYHAGKAREKGFHVEPIPGAQK